MDNQICPNCGGSVLAVGCKYCEHCANAKLERMAVRLRRLEEAVDKVIDVPFFLTPVFWPLLRGWLLNAREQGS